MRSAIVTWGLEEERWESAEFVLCEVSITALCRRERDHPLDTLPLLISLFGFFRL